MLHEIAPKLHDAWASSDTEALDVPSMLRVELAVNKLRWFTLRAST